MIKTDQGGSTTELTFVTGAEHIALRRVDEGSRSRHSRRTVAFLAILDTSIGHGGRSRRAKRHTRLDGHARRIDIARSFQQPALDLIVATLGHVGARGLDGRGGHVERIIVQRDTRRAAADLG